MKVSIIIPAYNERESVAAVIREVDKLGLDKEIVVVDDGSTDGTTEVLRQLALRPDIKVLFQPVNRGKGSAVRAALAQVTGQVVVIQDADLEYRPEDLLSLLAPIRSGECQAVFGSRFLGRPRFISARQEWGNRCLTWITNRLYGSHLTDMETCYKMVRRDLLEDLSLKARGFEIEPEITARLLKRGIPIKELPISYRGRGYAAGKKIRWKDALKAIAVLLKYRFTRS